jgi:hypothetical protein
MSTSVSSKATRRLGKKYRRSKSMLCQRGVDTEAE